MSKLPHSRFPIIAMDVQGPMDCSPSDFREEIMYDGLPYITDTPDSLLLGEFPFNQLGFPFDQSEEPMVRIPPIAEQDNSAVDSIGLLSVPPPGVYTSKDAMLLALNAHAAKCGYAITTKSSTPADRSPAKVYYQCDRSGNYDNRHQPGDNSRRLNTGTRKTNCPFRLTGVEIIPEDGTANTWIFFVFRGEHNHEPSGDARAHPALRRSDAKESEELIWQMLEAGATPRVTMAALRNRFPETRMVIQDVYNIRTRRKTMV
jgi:hypothetical protein